MDLTDGKWGQKTVFHAFFFLFAEDIRQTVAIAPKARMGCTAVEIIKTRPFPTFPLSKIQVHTAGLVADFKAKKEHQKAQTPTRNLAPVNFFLFPKMNNALAGIQMEHYDVK